MLWLVSVSCPDHRLFVCESQLTPKRDGDFLDRSDCLLDKVVDEMGDGGIVLGGCERRLCWLLRHGADGLLSSTLDQKGSF